MGFSGDEEDDDQAGILDLVFYASSAHTHADGCRRGKRGPRVEPVSKHHIQPVDYVENGSALVRNGTAEPVSRDQILRRERGQRKKICSLQLTTQQAKQDWHPKC